MTTTLTHRVYTGATYAELVNLLERWSHVVGTAPTWALDPAKLADAAAQFDDVLENIRTEDPGGRDGANLDEWIESIGLCPDDPDHLLGECHEYGCQNYLEELADLAPWGTSTGNLGGWA